MPDRSSSNLRIAVIGAGQIAEAHLQCLRDHEDVDLVGIANRSGNNLEKLMSSYNIERSFTNWETMLNETKPDAVWIISSILSLFEITHKVISMGYPCFIEKPVTLNSQDIKTLAELASQKSVKAMVGFNRRFFSPILKAWSLSQSAGELRSIHLEINEDIQKVRDKNKHPETVIDKWMIANSIHLIDLITLFCEDFTVQNLLQTNIEDPDKFSFHAQLSINNGKGLGSLHGDWSSPKTSNIKIRLDGLLINFYGLKEAEIVSFDNSICSIKPSRHDQTHKMGFIKQTDYFINALLHDTDIAKPASNLWDCYKSVQLAETIQYIKK